MTNHRIIKLAWFALWFAMIWSTEVVVMAEGRDDTLSVPGFLGRPSTEKWGVQIKANGLHFGIPRNYLYSAALRPNYGVFFQIVAALPDFDGANTSNIDQFQGPNWWKYPNTITMALSVGNENRNRNTLEHAAQGELQDTEFGLKLAKGDPRYPYLDVFVNLEKHAVVECETKGAPDNGLSFPKRCRVWVTVADRVTFQCEYLREQLKNWQAINKGIHALLGRFSIKGNEQ
jgi:hypothetical protein